MKKNILYHFILCLVFMGMPAIALTQEVKPNFDTQYRDKAKKWGIAAIVLVGVGGISEGIRAKLYGTTIEHFTKNFSTSDTSELALGVSGIGLIAAGIGCGVVSLGYCMKDLYSMAEYKLYLLEQHSKRNKLGRDDEKN